MHRCATPVAHVADAAPSPAHSSSIVPVDGRRVQGYSSGVVRIVNTHLRAGGVTEFLQNSDAMRCWGALRRARSAQEARTIAGAARTTVPKAQSALECLASIGLAEPIGAHVGTRRGSGQRGPGAGKRASGRHDPRDPWRPDPGFRR